MWVVHNSIPYANIAIKPPLISKLTELTDRVISLFEKNGLNKELMKFSSEYYQSKDDASKTADSLLKQLFNMIEEECPEDFEIPKEFKEIRLSTGARQLLVNNIKEILTNDFNKIKKYELSFGFTPIGPRQNFEEIIEPAVPKEFENINSLEELTKEVKKEELNEEETETKDYFEGIINTMNPLKFDFKKRIAKGMALFEYMKLLKSKKPEITPQELVNLNTVGKEVIENIYGGDPEELYEILKMSLPRSFNPASFNETKPKMEKVAEYLQENTDIIEGLKMISEKQLILNDLSQELQKKISIFLMMTSNTLGLNSLSFDEESIKEVKLNFYDNTIKMDNKEAQEKEMMEGIGSLFGMTL